MRTRLSVLMCAAFFCFTASHANACVEKDYEGDYFYLKNTCSHPINIKYTFSQSRQIAGNYTTLRPKQRTFDRAKKTEGHKSFYCDFPAVPQSIHGDCIQQ